MENVDNSRLSWQRIMGIAFKQIYRARPNGHYNQSQMQFDQLALWDKGKYGRNLNEILLVIAHNHNYKDHNRYYYEAQDTQGFNNKITLTDRC